jgi:hypothetical protein
MGVLNKTLKVLEDMLECLQTQKENDGTTDELLGDILEKSCLANDELLNCACTDEVIENGLDKAANTLVVVGDSAAQYPAVGQTISLMDAAGNICGSATVADPLPTYTPDADDPENTELGQTTINIADCELQEDKSAADITQAKPVLTATALAVKAVVTKTNLAVLKKTAEREIVKEEAVKGRINPDEPARELIAE